MPEFPSGWYDLLCSRALQRELEKLGLVERAQWKKLSSEELRHRLSLLLSKELERYLEPYLEQPENWQAKLTEMVGDPEFLELVRETLPVKSTALTEIKPPPPHSGALHSPDIHLAVSALLSGSSRSPSLRSQIIKELSTCDRAEWLVSFIKFSGIRALLDALRAFTQCPSDDGTPRLRIATTTYMGVTDIKAIETLLELPNTEVRISYDTKRTRLHAKAYLFHRRTGFGSAYIGSANISKAAHDDGLEWTAKISQFELPYLWRQVRATFESHWEDTTEFTLCTPEGLSALAASLRDERSPRLNEETIPFFDLRPYGYQQAILEDIANERASGKHRHLIIAATGTGKTMIAAFDYQRYCRNRSSRPRLLFVAHREELLMQARATFRQVLRDGSFGELLVGGAIPETNNHLFCTVQSWNSREFNRLAPNYFEYVVLDEAHHASASSYQKLIAHVQSNVLIGLTATPERMDGVDIRNDFGGAFTHEIRLPEAIERALLVPFHYYGIPDFEEVDFSSLRWSMGRYDPAQMRAQLEHNEGRAKWVIGQIERYVANIHRIRALGFCVSVAHAEFMAEFCQKHNIKALSLNSESPKAARDNARRMLEEREVNFIFTVDLYNEGVDIPSVDTILFLRPTESVTVYLQQLGRGLRLHAEKSHVTILDFIAPQNRRFSYAKRFRSLMSRWDIAVDKQVKEGFSYLPSGCLINLEKQAKEHVLENIRQASGMLRVNQLVEELKKLKIHDRGEVTLAKMLEYLHLEEPDEIYRRSLPHALMEQACDQRPDLQPWLKDLAKGFRRLCLMDDTYLIQEALGSLDRDEVGEALTNSLLHSQLWGARKPDEGTLPQVHRFVRQHPNLKRDLKELLEWLLAHRSPTSDTRFQATGPLRLHSSYSREQVLLSLGQGSFERPVSSREGVLHVPEKKIDCFFADIHKSESDFSPTTMYEDYAITERLFHWQSQSQTSETSTVGQRYIHHFKNGYIPMLFIRERKKLATGLTAPYFLRARFAIDDMRAQSLSHLSGSWSILCRQER